MCPSVSSTGEVIPVAKSDSSTPEPKARPSASTIMEQEQWRSRIVAKLCYDVGKDPDHANERDWFMATALAVRDRIIDRWMDSTRRTYEQGKKRVYYLSLEFLIGRLLMDSISNLNQVEPISEALKAFGIDLTALREEEPDAALGNGGLGRLAACFMESLASLGIPAHGYGIRYENGLFRQLLPDGWQKELPEDWLVDGCPWEFRRPEVQYRIGFGGRVTSPPGATDLGKRVWTPDEVVKAIGYDTPMVGWRGKHINTLRLWQASSVDPISLEDFNRGDHLGALAGRVRAEAISKVLYPSDSSPAGQELRLRQEYFFTAASISDILRRHIMNSKLLVQSLPDHVAIQINDTHPAIAVAELMRQLLDIYELPWAEAWDITTRTLSYTNHTLLPEALETWPVSLMERMLPRHMQIIYLLNSLHLDKLRESGADDALLSALSLIGEDGTRRVRMGNLAFLGSHKVNGVAALHTDLMKITVFRDFHSVFPDRITNKTNGITFRRWLYQANPELTKLLVDAVGPKILDDYEQFPRIAALAEDTAFKDKFKAIRRKRKETLARIIFERTAVTVDPDGLFDIQVKRIHEYKRQLLNVLETIALYDAIRAQPTKDWQPRVKIFAGKAAASYHMAKRIIKLAVDVARVVNNDPTMRGRLKVTFLPNYNVSLAEAIMPAADLSEQISTAGMEASGTGNMKFALNGALTIGTLDGANVEIRERVGDDNIFIFGLTAAEVEERRALGNYDQTATIAKSPALAEVLEAVGGGVFSPDDRGRYTDLVNAIRHNDYFLVASDFDDYFASQRKVDELWRDQDAWWTKAVLNTANVGWFSSDRTIKEYASEIWNASPVE
ncbi:glycogen/starch/alpha-glucan phosphorylase [Segnochrobactraceae bacterium EtOH-i3]